MVKNQILQTYAITLVFIYVSVVLHGNNLISIKTMVRIYLVASHVTLAFTKLIQRGILSMCSCLFCVVCRPRINAIPPAVGFSVYLLQRVKSGRFNLASHADRSNVQVLKAQSKHCNIKNCCCLNIFEINHHRRSSNIIITRGLCCVLKCATVPLGNMTGLQTPSM